MSPTSLSPGRLVMQWAPYELVFKETAITSRAHMLTRPTYFIRILDPESGRFGLGECPLFPGLSAEDGPDYPERLAEACRRFNASAELPPPSESAMTFAVEMALADLLNGSRRIYFPRADLSRPVLINGLVWMGSHDAMLERLEQKIHEGFRTIKLKIGGIDFDQELALIRHIRERFSAQAIRIRLDANGAFHDYAQAMSRLKALAPYKIHSIEQPIPAGRPIEMGRICRRSPIPVALDEELIGANPHGRKMLDVIRPHFLVIKPSLHGGFHAADLWRRSAAKIGAKVWITSALESNLGLAALLQYTSLYPSKRPQGLGTGALFTNNIPAPLCQGAGRLSFDPAATWDLSLLQSLAWQ